MKKMRKEEFFMYSETIVKLLEFMEKSKKTQLQIAKETGISNTVISQFIGGTYKGDNEEVANSIEKYLVLANERLENVDNTVFYKNLKNTKTSLFEVKYAHKNCEVVLLSGELEQVRQPLLNIMLRIILELSLLLLVYARHHQRQY